jgi:hypothetical protein
MLISLMPVTARVKHFFLVPLQLRFIHIPDPPRHPPDSIQVSLHSYPLIHGMNVTQPNLLFIPTRSIPEDVIAQVPVVARIRVAGHDTRAN